MVPFAFENITRSASRETSNVYPVSESARATHESFESHLQRASATKVDAPPQSPTRREQPHQPSQPITDDVAPNKPVPQPDGEDQRGDGDVQGTEDAELNRKVEQAAESNDEHLGPDAVSGEDVIVVSTATELQKDIPVVEPNASDESHDGLGGVVADKPTVAPRGEREIRLDAPDNDPAEAPADDEVIQPDDAVSDTREGKQISGDRLERSPTNIPNRHQNSSETSHASGTNEEDAAEAHLETPQLAETTIPAEKAPQTSSTPRHAQRADILPNQLLPAAPNTTSKLVAASAAAAAVEAASEDGSARHPSQQETDGAKSSINPTSTDVATAPGTPSRFAQHLLSRVEDPNARGLTITHADQARFVDRVARAVQAAGERDGTLRLRLSPPELGSLTLEVKVQGGVVSARVEADTSSARSLLLENLPLLRERLAEYGMRVDQFDVDLSDRQAGDTPGGPQQNDQQYEAPPRAKANLREPDDTLPAANSEAPTKNGNEQLNIIV